jgi:hypothetical protein
MQRNGGRGRHYYFRIINLDQARGLIDSLREAKTTTTTTMTTTMTMTMAVGLFLPESPGPPPIGSSYTGDLFYSGNGKNTI